MASPNAEFRLRWTRTGIGSDDDFTGRDPEQPRAYARIYRLAGGDQRWFWTASDGFRSFGTGLEASARKAAVRAEEHYWR